MTRVDALRFWLGITDLLLALALVVLPLFMDVSNCGPGVLILFGSWGVALPVAAVGILLLISPRVGSVAALLLGIAALGVGLWATSEIWGRSWSGEDWFAVALLAPPLAQLPFGLLMRRALPRTAPTNRRPASVTASS